MKLRQHTSKQRLFMLLALVALGLFVLTEDTTSRQARFPATKQKNKMLNGQELALNGSATHSRWPFTLYTLNVYLDHSRTEDSALLSSLLNDSNFSLFEMTFMTSISASNIRSAWEESFAENCETYCDGAREDFNILLSKVEDVKESDTFVIKVYPDSFKVEFKADELSSQNNDFLQALVRIWLGKHPPSPEFKAALLTGFAD